MKRFENVDWFVTTVLCLALAFIIIVLYVTFAIRVPAASQRERHETECIAACGQYLPVYNSAGCFCDKKYERPDATLR